MAPSSIIGCASSAVLPLAIRTAGSLRSFHGNVATAINVHERTILSPKNSFQRHSYSSAASPSPAKKLLDENLIRIIDSEIKTLNHVQELPIPNGFSFWIKPAADPAADWIVLAREDGHESIRIGVTMADLKGSVCGDDNDHICHSCKIFADKNKRSSGSSFPMTCFIFKNGLKRPAHIGFRVMASADNIAIKSSMIFDGLTKSIGSDFSGKLKHALLKYLEIRGIEPSTAEYFQKYIINKNREEELQWLMKLRRFIKK